MNERAQFLILSTKSLSATATDGLILEARGDLAAASHSQHTSDTALRGMVPGHGLWILDCQIGFRDGDQRAEAVIKSPFWHRVPPSAALCLARGEVVLAREIGGRQRPCPPAGVALANDPVAAVDFASEHARGTMGRR